MVQFKKIIIDRKTAQLANISYIPDVLELVNTYREKLFDDYFLEDAASTASALVSLIERTSPYFWAVTGKDGDFKGFVYLDDWQGSSKKRHCATVTTCFDKRFWGKFTKRAGKLFVKYVFRKYKISKLKAEVYSSNKYAISLLKQIGFTRECTLKSETYVCNKPVDIDIYSIIKCANAQN